MKLKTILHISGIAAALCLGNASLLAQDDNGGGPGGPPPDGGPGFDGPGNPGGGPGGRFDPAQFRERMMDQVRKNLNVTNDADWSALQPLVQKVMEARREADPRMRGPGGGPGGPPPWGGPSPDGGPGGPPPDGAPGGSGGPGRFGPQPSAEQKALQKAVEDKAPSSEIKSALEKYRAARKDKQAKLEAAQASLKSALTQEQEGQAVLMGLLP